MFWATLPSPHTICQEEGGGGEREEEGEEEGWKEEEVEEKEEDEEEEEEGGGGGRTITTVRGATVGWCSEGQLWLTLRTSNELKVQTLRKGFLSLLLSEAVQLFPFPYELQVIKRKCVLVPSKANISNPISKVDLRWRRSFQY